MQSISLLGLKGLRDIFFDGQSSNVNRSLASLEVQHSNKTQAYRICPNLSIQRIRDFPSNPCPKERTMQTKNHSGHNHSYTPMARKTQSVIFWNYLTLSEVSRSVFLFLFGTPGTPKINSNSTRQFPDDDPIPLISTPITLPWPTAGPR